MMDDAALLESLLLEGGDETEGSLFDEPNATPEGGDADAGSTTTSTASLGDEEREARNEMGENMNGHVLLESLLSEARTTFRSHFGPRTDNQVPAPPHCPMAQGRHMCNRG